MKLRERTRDWLVSAVLLTVVGALVVVGWLSRDAAGSPVPAPLAGERAPSLALPTIDGRGLSLDTLRGHVVLLNIWATWCGPCRQEMPSIERLYRRHRDRGLRVVSVAVDDHPGERQPDGRIVGPVSQFMERYGLTFPVAVDPTGGTEARFGTQYLPTTVLIDRAGRIRSKEVGGRTWDTPPQADLVESLLEERNR